MSKTSRIGLAAVLATGLSLPHLHAETSPRIPEGIPVVATLASKGFTPTYADVAYGDQSEAQRLDIYLPSDNNTSHPVALFVHGGGFAFGDKTMSLPGIVGSLLQHGIAVATVNYRMSGEAKFPAAPQDLGRAIEFIRSQSGRYQLDPQRLVTMGESAGANLAALSGTAAGATVMRGALVNPQADIRPQGVVALYPPVDFLQLDTLLAQQGCHDATHDSGDSFESRYLGGPLQRMRNAAITSNPITYIDEKTPPFFVENGDNDCKVGTAQSILLVDALRTKQIPTTYVQLKGAGHGGSAFEAKDNADRIAKWTLSVLGSASR